MSKALLIKSQIDKNGGEVGKWNNFNNAPSYIQGIHTGKMLEDISAEKLGALISGIPTPWARAKLFKFAFSTIAAPLPKLLYLPPAQQPVSEDVPPTTTSLY